MAPRLLTPKQANATHHKHGQVHLRLPDDNESTKCGSREGAASLHLPDVTCPACNPALLPFRRRG